MSDAGLTNKLRQPTSVSRKENISRRSYTQPIQKVASATISAQSTSNAVPVSPFVRPLKLKADISLPAQEVNNSAELEVV